MTTFNYTGGAFSNLVGGTPGANVSNLVQLLNDLKTFLNGANLTDTNVTAAGLTDASLASPNNAVWTPVLQVAAANTGAANITTTVGCYTAAGSYVASGGASAGVSGFWIPPTASDIAVAGKTTRFRIRVAYLTNGTAPAITITWGLYPVNTSGGLANQLNLTFGTVIAGSTVSVVTPSANASGIATGSSFDFSAVTAGSPYVIGAVGNGTQNANSLLSVSAVLEQRHT